MCSLFVVDDDELFFYITQKMSSRIGLFRELTHFTNGSDLLQFLSANKDNAAILPDTIFLDLYSPGFDPWQFLDAYQHLHDKLSKKIMLYVVSASIMPNDQTKAKTYECVADYIVKPIQRNTLQDIFLTAKQLKNN